MMIRYRRFVERCGFCMKELNYCSRPRFIREFRGQGREGYSTQLVVSVDRPRRCAVMPENARGGAVGQPWLLLWL
jgi:hypothetical protein